MFEFEGDWFNATAIAAFCRFEGELRICVHLYGHDKVHYSFETEEKVKEAMGRFVADWRKAIA